MKKFAEAVPAGSPHEVTLLADFSGAPGLACKRTRAPADEGFCEYLIHNSSIEFMGANVERALACGGLASPYSQADIARGNVAGSQRIVNPPFTKRHVELLLEFKGAVGDQLPYLTYVVTALDDE